MVIPTLKLHMSAVLQKERKLLVDTILKTPRILEIIHETSDRICFEIIIILCDLPSSVPSKHVYNLIEYGAKYYESDMMYYLKTYHDDIYATLHELRMYIPKHLLLFFLQVPPSLLMVPLVNFRIIVRFGKYGINETKEEEVVVANVRKVDDHYEFETSEVEFYAGTFNSIWCKVEFLVDNHVLYTEEVYGLEEIVSDQLKRTYHIDDIRYSHQNGSSSPNTDSGPFDHTHTVWVHSKQRHFDLNSTEITKLGLRLVQNPYDETTPFFVETSVYGKHGSFLYSTDSQQENRLVQEVQFHKKNTMMYMTFTLFFAVDDLYRKLTEYTTRAD